MERNNTVRDLMIDVFDFPHLPYWFTIRQAMEILKRVAVGKEKAVFTDIILIFDEKYKFMGTVSHRDIIIGLEPSILQKFEHMKHMTEASPIAINEDSLARVLETMFREDAKKQAERQVSEIMEVVKISVSSEDSPAKAAYLMARHNLSYIPVLENKQKLVGMLSMSAVFNWCSKVILE